MSLRSRIAIAIAHDIEIVGPATSSSRYLHKALALGIILAAMPHLSFADQASQVLRAPETITSIDLKGDSNERHSAKVIGKYVWPKQNEKQEYTKDELKLQYDAAENAVNELKEGVKGIVNVNNIEFYTSYKDAGISGQDYDDLDKAFGIVSLGEAPFSIRLRSFFSDIGLSPGDLTSRDILVVPHVNDPNLNKNVKMMVLDPLASAGDPESKTLSYKYTLYHEAGHSFHSSMTNEALNLRNITIENVSNKNVSQESDYKLFLASQESLADCFAIMKLQQEYYIDNKDDIILGRLPKILPFIEKLRDLRHGARGGDPIHDTSVAIQEVINQLSKPGMNEKLAKANTAEILMESYHTIDKTYGTLLDIAYINKRENITFSKTYQANHVKPVFDDYSVTFAP